MVRWVLEGTRRGLLLRGLLPRGPLPRGLLPRGLLPHGLLPHGLLACGLLTCTLAGCVQAEPSSQEPIAVQDDLDRRVVLQRPALRIVSLIPSVTEIIVRLGAADRVVARTDFDEDPLLAGVPSLGGGLDPNMEVLTALEPDLVVGWADAGVRSIITRMPQLGVPAYGAATQTIDDVQRHIRNLGTLLGLEDEASRLASEMSQGLASVSAGVGAVERPSVFYVVWHDPPMTAGPGSYIDELIRIAGGENSFGDAPGAWPEISLEELVRRDPDIVVLTSENPGDGPPEWLGTSPGWRDLSAVRSGRIGVVGVDLFNRPGPGMVESARILAEILHPRGAGR